MTMKHKSVAIFGPSPRFLSGLSYYTVSISNALSEFVDIEAILFRKMLPKKLFPGWRRVGDKLSELEFNMNVKVNELLDWYNPLTWLKAFLILRKSDVIILEWWTSSVAHMYLAIQLLNKIFTRKKVIVEFHEVVDPLESSIMPIRMYSRITGRLIRSLASHFVVHSESDKDLISKIYRISKERIEVIPHGLYDHYKKIEKETARKKLGIVEDFVILFFGLLRPYKGVKYLVEAFEKLPENVINSSRLLIVGEVWEDKEITKRIKNSAFEDKISLIDRYVSDEEVSAIFSACDVVVLPYVRASQSGVAHIAMSFGLPIIATRVGGISESLKNYDGTHFVEPENSRAISNELIKVFEDRQKKYNKPSNLEWKNIAKKWIDYINRIQ